MDYRPYSSTTMTFEHLAVRREPFLDPGVRADVLCPRPVRLPGVRDGFHAVKDRT